MHTVYNFYMNEIVSATPIGVGPKKVVFERCEATEFRARFSVNEYNTMAKSPEELMKRKIEEIGCEIFALEEIYKELKYQLEEMQTND